MDTLIYYLQTFCYYVILTLGWTLELVMMFLTFFIAGLFLGGAWR